MKDEPPRRENPETRFEPRRTVDPYHSVEFAICKSDPIYHFNLWNISSNGICFLVKEDSAVLKKLKVGDRLKMIYYRSDSLTPTMESLETEIRHITQAGQGRFRGHSLVGLSILGKSEDGKAEI